MKKASSKLLAPQKSINYLVSTVHHYAKASRASSFRQQVGIIGEDEEDVRLLDFGETFTNGTEPERIAQPGGLRAPETLVTDRFDHKLDLWRVGAVVRMDTCSSKSFFSGRTNTCYIDILVCIQTDTV